MKRTLGAFGAVVLAASAIGLAGSDVRAGSGNQPTVAAPEGDITVWAMGTEGDNLGVLADQFMEEFPDVSVEVTAIPWNAANERIVSAIAGGEVPDVSLIGTTWMGEFAHARWPRADAREHRPGAVLRGCLELDRRRRGQLRRAVVRRDPCRLLPHRPRRKKTAGSSPTPTTRTRLDSARPGWKASRRRSGMQPAAREASAHGRT